MPPKTTNNKQTIRKQPSHSSEVRQVEQCLEQMAHTDPNLSIKTIDTNQIPSHKYSSEYSQLAKKASMLGMTIKEMATKIFDLPVEVLDEWLRSEPEFHKSIKDGSTIADAEVAGSLYKLATGFKFWQEQVVQATGDVVQVECYQPPNIAAIKYWLNNRCPDRWVEKQSLKFSGNISSQAKVVVIDKTDEEL